MGKETKEMLKTLIANTELIMKHLNINKPGSTPGQGQKVASAEAVQRKPVKKAAAKKARK